MDATIIEIGLVTLFRYHIFFWNNSAIKIYDKIITQIWPSSTPTLKETKLEINRFVETPISFKTPAKPKPCSKPKIKII